MQTIPQKTPSFLVSPPYLSPSTVPRQRLQLFNPGQFGMAARICVVPLVRAPLGNTAPMPIANPPVVSTEPEIVATMPACDETLGSK